MTHSKAARQAEKQAVGLMTAKHGLRYLHVRKLDMIDELPMNKGGCTIAYAKARPNDNVILVSTALVNDHDSYCKADGRRIAAHRFDRGYCVALRVPKNMSTSYFLKCMFTPMVSM